VLFSALSRLRLEPQRQMAAFFSGARVLAAVALPVCLVQAALADPGVRTIFKAKWYPAIPLVQVLSAGMALRVLAWPSLSLLLGQGRYRTFVAVQGVGATIFLLMIAAAGALSDSPHAAMAVAVAAAIYFTVEGPVSMLIATRPGGRGWSGVWEVYARPLAVGLAAAVAGWVVSSFIPASDRWGQLARLAAGGLAATLVYTFCLRRFGPDLWDQIVARLRRTPGTGASPAGDLRQ
jgi:PST family polysaccharide transporter